MFIVLPFRKHLLTKKKILNPFSFLSCHWWHLFWELRSQPKVRDLVYYVMLVKVLWAYFWSTGNFLLKNKNFLWHFYKKKNNASCQPVHKSKAIYWCKRFIEKLYLYFDQFCPVSWQLQHRFLLCPAVRRGLARNCSSHTVVRTIAGRLIHVAPGTAGDTFSGQQKPALAHSFLKGICFHLRFEPRF